MTNTKAVSMSDILALDELYDALRSFRRSTVLAGKDLDFELQYSLHASLTALRDAPFADRVMGTLDVRPAATLVEVVTEILEES